MKAKITPFLLFNTEAEEAARFYVSVFNGKLVHVQRYPENSPMQGAVLTATFEILGVTMTALNWGQEAKYTESISFAIEPETQAEVDHFWGALTADGGEEGPCGWLKDKFGVSWQIIPTTLGKMLGDPDPEKSRRVMEAMLKMKKIEIPLLKQAYDGA